MRSDLILRRVSPFDPEVSAFIDALDEFQKSLYPPESNHLDSREVLDKPECCLVGAHRNDRLVGIGAAKKNDKYGELKRFYVPEEFRGQGISECIILALEEWLRLNDVLLSCLETGIHQRAALSFYERLGYNYCEPFGEYKKDPLSLFMSKDLLVGETIPLKNTGPFYMVAFSSQLREASEKYVQLADRMLELAKEQDGFLGLASSRDSKGRGMTASYWRDEQTISSWRQHPEHIQAQNLGRTEFYSEFKTTVAYVASIT